MADLEKKSLGWWVGTLLAPLGIIGGPIEIASICSGLIEWHGPIGLIVDYWHINVALPFHNILQFLFGWACRIYQLPVWQVPKDLSDYLALGVLTATSFFRTSILTNVSLTDGDDFEVLSRFIPKSALYLIAYVLTYIVIVFAWPLIFIFPVVPFWYIITNRTSGINMKKFYIRNIILISPILLFLCLYVANLFYGLHQF